MLWSVVLGLSLGAVFPLVLTLPIDVADRPADVGAVAALMLLGGYVLASTAPVVLGAIRDVSGSFVASFSVMVVIAVGLAATTLLLDAEAACGGIRRDECRCRSPDSGTAGPGIQEPAALFSGPTLRDRLCGHFLTSAQATSVWSAAVLWIAMTYGWKAGRRGRCSRPCSTSRPPGRPA